MAKKRNRLDPYVAQVQRALVSQYGAKHPRARIEVYRYNAGSIRIRIIDPDFEGQDQVEREANIWPILDSLADDIRAEISVLLLITPKESKLSIMSLEFDDPTLSEL